MKRKKSSDTGAGYSLRMGKQFVPYIERILFVFPALFTAKIRDGRSEICLLTRFFGLIGDSGCRIAGYQSGSGMSYEWKLTALLYAGKKSLQIVLLLVREVNRVCQ